MQGMQESGNAGNQGCDTENQNGNLDIAVGMTQNSNGKDKFKQ